MARGAVDRKILIGILGVLGLAAGLGLLLLGGPSDRELIISALKTSTEAGENGRPGPILEFLSREFTYQDSPVGSRMDIAKFIKESKPKVVVLQPEPVIEGDSARIVSPVELSFGGFSILPPQRVEGVVIELKKEMGFRYGVLPYPTWKVTDVSVRGAEPTLPAY